MRDSVRVGTRQIYYGWVIVAALSVTETVTWGIVYSSCCRAIGGAIALGANGARAVGPVGASLLLVALGSYVSVFWALSASLVLAGVLVLFVGWGAQTPE